ncbi:AAA family ATPase [Desulfobacter postgatei]|uniref:AAA domain-containing protein n=1 Tax=Desulfobacter postgatei 2ac9 TaxID=879212 RepID=I5AZV1_9BACT|nr:DUF3696 domain-containing protein [Desulfobacter postgatei]EIM62764.1 Protein of unknown function (DUF3696) [Desulfobacter postgatei 2ac9]
MITSLHLGNFKAFAKTQNIPVKPLTLIFGANSAGKSSIIHSLAMAHEAMRTGELDLFRTDIGGSSIDLGGFKQYIHRREITRRLEWGLTLGTGRFTGRLREIMEPMADITMTLTMGMPLDPKTDEPEPGAAPHVMTYELESDGQTLLRMSRRPGNQMALDLLPYKHPVLQRIISALLEGFTTTGAVSGEDLKSLEQPMAEIIAGLRSPMGTLFPKGIKDEGRDEDQSGSQLNLFPVSRGNRQEDLAKALRFFLPRTLDELIQELNTVMGSEINRLQYLGPLRSYPARHLAFAEHDDINWYAGGGYAWDVVRRNKEVRDKVNAWLSDAKRLSTPYELVIKNLLTIEDLEADYEHLVSGVETAMIDDDWSDFETAVGETVSGDHFGELYGILGRLKKSEEKFAAFQELILYDRRTETQVSHRDVGIGVSQVLPVLVSAFAAREKIIAIEQPEIHLHPALQAELGDIFIESALAGNNNNTFLLETHSEHLILRILRRIRETSENELEEGATPIKPDQVAVLYVQPGKKGSAILHIPVNEEGEFERPWPQGFFAERARELF